MLLVELVLSGGEALPCGNVRWKTKRDGGAGMVSAFMPVLSGNAVRPGRQVSLMISGQRVFQGYVFSVEQTGEGRTIAAYDQLRYLLYRDTKVFTGRTAGEIAREICGERGLTLADAPSGGPRIPSLIADNRPLLDIIRLAMEQTVLSSGERLCFYDDAGTLRMRGEGEMALPVMIDGSGLLSAYRFSEDIGTDTYNRVQLVRKNRRTGRREIFIREDREAIARWGTLQYCAQVPQNMADGEIAAMLERLLGQKNRAVRGLQLQCAGDCRFRAGAVVQTELPGESFSGKCRLLEADHLFSGGGYTMKLKAEEVL